MLRIRAYISLGFINSISWIFNMKCFVHCNFPLQFLSIFWLTLKNWFYSIDINSITFYLSYYTALNTFSFHQCFNHHSSSSTSHLDYLQTISHIPTMHFQPAIPQLPIPSLQNTCQRYLATQHAFLSPGVFNKTKALVEEFVNGEGHGEWMVCHWNISVSEVLSFLILLHSHYCRSTK